MNHGAAPRPSSYKITPDHSSRMASGQGLIDNNPWALDEETSRYDDDLSEILGTQGESQASDGRIADGSGNGEWKEEEEQQDGYLVPQPDSRSDFLLGEEAESSRPGTASSGSYTAKLRSILGSEEAEDPDEDVVQTEIQPPAEGSEESPQAESYTRFDSVDTSRNIEMDTSLNLPDDSLQSIPNAPDDARFRYRPSFPKGRDVSLSMSMTSSQHSGFESPQRPMEYPSLSRLRATGMLRPTSSPVNRTADHFRFPFASLSSLASGNRNSLDPSWYNSNSLSRSTSISSSISARKGRIFPYGPNGLDAASDFSSASSLRVATAEGDLELTSPHSGLMASSIVNRGLFKWSALRKVAAFFQDGGRRHKEISLPSSNQTLPQFTGDKNVFAIGNTLIAIGTTEGYALVFYFSQDVKCICGSPSSGRTSGQVTSLAFSADNTFLAVGHEKGSIFLYDLAKPSSPARQVPSVTASEVAAGRKEGHLTDSSVTHVAFVGARHTAIFSADENGLSFYHSLGKILGVASNDTLRILGRYPETHQAATTRDGSPPRHEHRRSPPVLALVPLPLGPVDHPSDVVHFVALMTFEKLVVVGLSPSARTWYRRSAPNTLKRHPPHAYDVQGAEAVQHIGGEGETSTTNHSYSAHATQTDPPTGGGQRTACAAWFPALQADDVSPCTDRSGFVPPRLAFAFDRKLFSLELNARESTIGDGGANGNGNASKQHHQQKQRELDFTERLLWVDPTEEIEGLQWLSHELIILLTPTNLKLFDLRVGRVTEQEPLEPTLHGLHRPTWRGTGEARSLQHKSTLVAESMRVHKGRIFFLTQSQVVVGQLISWADRLLALVSAGDFLSAIDLATQYFEGKVPGSLIGLPQDQTLLRDQVGSKLRELMSASARYTFSPDRLTDATHVTADGRGVDRTELFVNLTRKCTLACLAMGNLDFLFNDLYDLFSQNGIESIFVEQMVDFILSGQMRQLPLPVTQRMITTCQQDENWDLAEKIIWHVDPLCLDLDQVLKLCTKQKLYDAMIYVYNTALKDYISPIIDLLEPVKEDVKGRNAIRQSTGWADMSHDAADAEEYNMQSVPASEGYKIFSYLSVVLSGKSYPAQQVMEDSTSKDAKASLYSFIFSDHCIVWPPGPGVKLILSVDESEEEPTYPYLLLLLRFDAEAFLDALDIAFEDSFLDEDEDRPEQGFLLNRRSVSRQSIIDSLLEVSPQLSENDLIFASIFVSRNAPKYPQFLRLSTTNVQVLLQDLARLGEESTRDDRQLAIESLLSAHRHSFTDKDLAMFEEAGFWRILQSAYKATGKWEKLITMLLNDSDLGQDIFHRLEEVLTKAPPERKASGSELTSMIIQAVPQLMDYSVQRAVRLLDRFYPTKHWDALQALDAYEQSQLDYLKVFLDPARGDQHHHGEDNYNTSRPLSKYHLGPGERELFVTLQARLDPNSLLRILDEHQTDTGYFDLEIVVECARRNELYDVVLWALDRQDHPSKAFDALDDIIAAQALKMRGVRQGGEVQLEEVAAQLRKATDMAVRICSERCEPSSSRSSSAFGVEEMWYRLLRSLVGLVHAVGTPNEELFASTFTSTALDLSRGIVQDTLSAMVTSMSAATVSFPHLFRRLVQSGSPDSSSDDGSANGSGRSVRYYGEVKTVVEGMVTACRLRTDLLSITNRIFDRDTFSSLAQLTRQSKRGWRPPFEGIHQSIQTTGKEGNYSLASGEISLLPAGASPFASTRRRSRRASSTSTATTTTVSATRKPPARGSDFLSTSSPSLDSLPGRMGHDGSSSEISSSPITPRLDKGKGREKPIEEVGSSIQRQSGEADLSDYSSQQGGGGMHGDYFTSHLSNIGDEDLSDNFLSSPPAALTEGGLSPNLSRQAQDSDSVMVAEEFMGRVGPRRGPVRVRLGHAG